MDLAQLPLEDGFRLRGQQVTRLETFVDAAFAFSLTLLVIFFNDLPDTVAELREALRRVPTFAFCFVLLALFWAAHNRWSRRYGLEDTRSTVLSLGLVLVVLVYIYPLRMVVSSGFAVYTHGWVPSELGVDRDQVMLDLQTAFIVYSVGFGLLSLIVLLLNHHALRLGGALRLDAVETYETRTEIGIHGILLLTAVASIGLSLVALRWNSPDDSRAALLVTALPVWAYATLGGMVPLYAWQRRRRRVARIGA